jgi:hypothetical protein
MGEGASDGGKNKQPAAVTGTKVASKKAGRPKAQAFLFLPRKRERW